MTIMEGVFSNWKLTQYIFRLRRGEGTCVKNFPRFIPICIVSVLIKNKNKYTLYKR